MVGGTVNVSWTAAVDNETAQADLAYGVGYSADGGVSWAELGATGPGAVFYSWNTTGLPEGDGYRVRVRAFDGSDWGPFDSSGHNFSVRHLDAEYSGPRQAGFADAGSPVEWIVGASGSGSGVCNYSGLPGDRVGPLGVSDSAGGAVLVVDGGSWAAWDCNLSAWNYSLAFSTPGAVVSQGAESTGGGVWCRDYSVSSARLVENVSFSASVPGYLVAGAEFAGVWNGTGWVDVTPALAEIDCDGAAPSFSSFLVGGGVWRVCKKDSDGDGVFDYFRFVAPLVGSPGVLAQACGLLPGSSDGPVWWSGSGGTGGQGDNGSASPVPSVSPTPVPTPTPLPLENETRVESVEEVNDSVAIIGPSVVAPGLVELGFLSGGSPGGGTAEFFAPDGKKFERQVGKDGSVRFYFDVEGDWIVRYGNETKGIEVKKEKIPAPKKAIIGGNATGAGEPTGLVAGAVEPWWYGLLFLLVGGLIATAWLLGRRTRVEKTYASGKVRVAAVAGKALKDATLVDIVPEGWKVGDFTEGMARKETVTGAALKWKRKELKKGERWIVEYNLQPPEEGGAVVLKRAELKAIDAKGRKVVELSNEVAVV